MGLGALLLSPPNYRSHTVYRGGGVSLPIPIWGGALYPFIGEGETLPHFWGWVASFIYSTPCIEGGSHSTPKGEMKGTTHVGRDIGYEEENRGMGWDGGDSEYL